MRRMGISKLLHLWYYNYRPSNIIFSIGWGEWDSVSCYTCGITTIDPENDEEGSYGTDPGENKKMYNHSCDLMDNGLGGNYRFAGQELEPRDWVEKIEHTEPKLDENGTAITVCKEEVLDTNGTVIEEARCDPVFRNWTETRKRPPKSYDMTMWVRKCPEGVRSCFKAQGNWDEQKPVFRGCSESKYAHGTTCKRELKAVRINPAAPLGTH